MKVDWLDRLTFREIEMVNEVLNMYIIYNKYSPFKAKTFYIAFIPFYTFNAIFTTFLYTILYNSSLMKVLFKTS